MANGSPSIGSPPSAPLLLADMNTVLWIVGMQSPVASVWTPTIPRVYIQSWKSAPAGLWSPGRPEHASIRRSVICGPASDSHRSRSVDRDARKTRRSFLEPPLMGRKFVPEEGFIDRRAPAGRRNSSARQSGPAMLVCTRDPASDRDGGREAPARPHGGSRRPMPVAAW